MAVRACRVHRSSKNIYAQIIDDVAGPHARCCLDPRRRTCGLAKTGADTAAAAAVGKLVAERAGKAGVKEVVFDRGAYIYHGRVKALAEAAREGGLSSESWRLTAAVSQGSLWSDRLSSGTITGSRMATGAIHHAVAPGKEQGTGQWHKKEGAARRSP